MAAAGASGGDALTVDQVFSTFLYTGTSSSQSHVTNIDLAGEGGLVWIKNREGTDRHGLYDTVRGAGEEISSNLTNAKRTATQTVTSFNNNGFSTGNDSTTGDNNKDYCAWSFRKASKFMTIVEYSGNGASSERSISHDLGGDVGAIFVKRTDTADNWYVGCWKSMPQNNGWKLNSTDAVSTYGYFGTTAPTASTFHVSSFNGTNASGGTYIAYIFADNSSEDAADRMISCGSYTGTGSAGNEVDIGFEPQWLLIKRADSTGSWYIVDNMRGFTAYPATSYSSILRPNSSDSENQELGGAYWQQHITPTGFVMDSASGSHNASSGKYIYIAIRRDDQAEVTDATDVFGVATRDSAEPHFNTSFDKVDFALYRSDVTGSNDWYAATRLTTNKVLKTNSTAAEVDGGTGFVMDFSNGWYGNSSASSNSYSWMWKRAKSYFDCVVYTGTGSARTIAHSLGVVPEMVWIKSRSNSSDWSVFHTTTGKGKYLALNETQSAQDDTTRFNNTAPTDTHFSVGGMNAVNGSGRTYISYHFATLAGVSKVGSFTGTGSDRTISCGFSNGARFVLIKRTSTTGPWLTFDSVRGINSGTEPMLRLNATNAQSSFDYIDPHSSGFSIQGDGGGSNTSGISYVFYAIA